jgi:hypothetical protein
LQFGEMLADRRRRVAKQLGRAMDRTLADDGLEYAVGAMAGGAIALLGVSISRRRPRP